MPASTRLRFAWRRYLRWAAVAGLALLAVPLILIPLYDFVAPPVSSLMLLRALHGNGIAKTWVKLDQISPWLARAVVTSEDARFCEHNGVDWIEMQGVIDDALSADEAPIRGASTIPMQTVKNLFLWDGRAVIRKGVEIPFAMWMDLVMSKRRILEIYLNIVEWAPGIYGAEQAARFHFRKSAAKLSQREAALLAAVLPNPIKRQAGKPSRGVMNIASRIMIRMQGMGPYLTCLGAKASL
jgi:monofunctional biosynthetic peptidoglycan transglycosylase